MIGNVVRFPTDTNAGVAYIGIQVRENNASGDVSDNVIIGNTIFGNGDTAIIGIALAQANSLHDRSTVMWNTIINTNKGINRSTPNNVLIGNRFTSVTTEYSGTPGTGDRSCGPVAWRSAAARNCPERVFDVRFCLGIGKLRYLARNMQSVD